MLTRQERQEIAERAKECKKEDELNWDQFSYVLLGIQSWRNDEELLDRIVELCNTSNMIELPRDKDGEVIHVGDTVYNEAGDWLEVLGIEYSYCDRVYINAYYVGRQDKDVFFPNELTHKATTTISQNIESFNEAVKVTAQSVEASMNKCVEAMKKLAEVFNRVCDNDD